MPLLRRPKPVQTTVPATQMRSPYPSVATVAYALTIGERAMRCGHLGFQRHHSRRTCCKSCTFLSYHTTPMPFTCPINQTSQTSYLQNTSVCRRWWAAESPTREPYLNSDQGSGRSHEGPSWRPPYPSQIYLRNLTPEYTLPTLNTTNDGTTDLNSSQLVCYFLGASSSIVPRPSPFISRDCDRNCWLLQIGRLAGAR